MLKKDKTKNAEKSEKKKSGIKLSDRKTMHGIVSIAVSCLVLAAVIIVNIIASTLTDKYSGLTADITSVKSFDLTEDSIYIANNVDKKVKITFLTSKSSYEAVDPYCKQASYLANQLAQNSDEMILVEYIDLVQNPSYENNYPDVELSTTDVIVSCGDKYKILTADEMFNFESYDGTYSYIASSQAEQQIDAAILTVTSDISTKVALVTDNCTDDYSYLKSTLTSNNYEISEISLITDDIPDDTDMVIVYAPTKDYTYDAVEKIREFLENNNQYGKSMLYVSYRKGADTPNIDKLLSDYGMKVEDALAFDMDSSRIAGNSYYDGIMCSFASELYTENISENDYPVIVSLASPISVTDDKTAQPLLILSEDSGMCPLDAVDGEWSMTDSVTGDVCVMAQGSTGTDEATSTVIVSGSTSMFEQSMLGSAFSNSQYVLDMFANLNDRDTDTIQLENKVITDYDLNISTQTANIVGVVIYAIIPLVILGVGIIIFLVRRNK